MLFRRFRVWGVAVVSEFVTQQVSSNGVFTSMRARVSGLYIRIWFQYKGKDFTENLPYAEWIL